MATVVKKKKKILFRIRKRKADKRGFPWVETGWADGGSSLISVKMEMHLDPQCLGDSREATVLPSLVVQYVLKLGVPQTSVLPELHSPLMVMCCWGRSVWEQAPERWDPLL